VYTQDVADGGSVSTSAFADAVVARLGRRAERARVRHHAPLRVKPLVARRDFVRPASRACVGVDVFVESAEAPETVGERIERMAEGTPLRLKMISNRGTKVYPPTGGLTECVDHWRCRFVARSEGATLDDGAVLALLGAIGSGFRWMHVEKLELHDGGAAYTRAQGED
jgi:isocitrate dehydrogenase